MLLSACSVKPHPINEGEDACAYCKMTVAEKKYATEIVSNTGKIYVFDDMHCMKSFIKENIVPSGDIKLMMVSDFYNPENLIPADNALLFTSESLHTPMNGKTVGLADSGALKRIQQEMQGNSLTIQQLLQ